MPWGRLTKRQQELADLLCLNRLSVAAAARHLGISTRTAYAHVRAIADRLPLPPGYHELEPEQRPTALQRILAYAPSRRTAAALEREQLAKTDDQQGVA